VTLSVAGVWLAGIALSSLAVASYLGPGYLPLGPSPSDAPYTIFSESNAPSVHPTRKVCLTCDLVRPARRVSHCRTCRRCVRDFDHHCPVLGTCVGRNNYLPYFAGLGSLSLATVLLAATSGVALGHSSFLLADGHTLTTAEWTRFGVWVAQTIVSLAMIPVAWLYCYHVQLAARDMTTKEYESWGHPTGVLSWRHLARRLCATPLVPPHGRAGLAAVSLGVQAHSQQERR
jgi:palmitoyltransferase ZDHHC9/14/18/palmitoyltransferase